jgi:hypothetical protein
MVRIILAILVPAIFGACGGGGSNSAPVMQPPGAADDTTALQALVDKGGLVRLEARTYHLSRTLVIRQSGVALTGAGDSTVLEYTPSQTLQHCVNDRVITTPCSFDDVLPRQIAAPIGVGDTSFMAINAPDVQDVKPGDWLLINDYDSDIGDRVAVDWVQVESVVGLQINVTQPFRMAFTTARPWVARKSGLGFEHLTPLVEGTELRNFRIVVDDVPSPNTGGISIFGALDTTIDSVSVTNSNGQPLYCYLSKGVAITNSHTQGGKVLSEFAASVDVTIQGNHFRSAGGPGFGLDLGLAFFSASGNYVDQSANAGLYVLYGVHDGTVSGNQVARVGSTLAGGSGSGMLVWGSQNIEVSSNHLLGGDGPASVGISVRPYAGELPEPDTGVTLTNNTITGFVTAVQTQ